MIKRAIYTVLKWFGRSPMRMIVHSDLDYEIKDLSTGISKRYKSSPRTRLRTTTITRTRRNQEKGGPMNSYPKCDICDSPHNHRLSLRPLVVGGSRISSDYCARLRNLYRLGA